MHNYQLLMEKFPKIALMLPHLGAKEKENEDLSHLGVPDADLLYFLGVGRGEAFFHFSDWLLQDKKRRLIFVEEDLEAISHFLHLPVAEKVLGSEQVHIALLEELDSYLEELPSARIEVFCLPSKEDEAFKENLLRKAHLSWSRHQDRLYGYQLFENFLSNVKRVSTSFYANKLRGRFQGVPAFICGAGPSLQKSVPLLKTLENRALIIGGGSTLCALLSQEILPHFGMAIDPNAEEYERLKNSLGHEMPFLFSTRVVPTIFQACKAPLGYMRSGVGGILELWMEETLGLTEPLLGRDLSLESLSVTAICLALAVELGCDPIFLTGVDLAYTGGKRYAAGVEETEPHKPAEMGVDRRICKVLNGKKVETALRWVMESAAFSDFAKKHPKTRFFNLSSDGLGFEFIDNCSLDEASQLLGEESNLRERVYEEISSAKMPEGAEGIVEGLLVSLARAICHLKILAGEETGSIPLAEHELEEELAYKILFFDAKEVLRREQRLQGEFPDIWAAFLDLAKKYQLVSSPETPYS